MTISPSYFLPPLPEGLEDLTELALDLAWSWSHGTDALWERIDPDAVEVELFADGKGDDAPMRRREKLAGALNGTSTRLGCPQGALQPTTRPGSSLTNPRPRFPSRRARSYGGVEPCAASW